VPDLKRFYDTYYQPNNAVLIVVGDVSEEDVRRAAQTHFGPIPRAADPPRLASALVEPPQKAMRKEEVAPSQLGVIIGGYHIPAARSSDIPALEVLSAILAGGDSSRLHRRVVRKDGVGVAAGGQVFSFEDPGLFMIFGVYLQADQADKLEGAMLDEIGKIASDKVTGDELTKAKNQLTAQFVSSLQRIEGIANQIGTSKLVVGDATAWIDDYQEYQQVTAADVQRVAQTYLIKDNLTLVVIPPAGAGAGGGK
jgi:predicted Zn-dependent peptidase